MLTGEAAMSKRLLVSLLELARKSGFRLTYLDFGTSHTPTDEDVRMHVTEWVDRATAESGDELNSADRQILMDVLCRHSVQWESAYVYAGVHPRQGREVSLSIAHRLIDVCHKWDPRLVDYQRGYFGGLMAAWQMAGLITEAEGETLRKELDTALAQEASKARHNPPWWDIAARLRL